MNSCFCIPLPKSHLYCQLLVSDSVSSKMIWKITHHKSFNLMIIKHVHNVNILIGSSHSSWFETQTDIFLFSCYTGLSYCDVAKLTRDNVVIGVDGDRWIFTERTKTNTSSKIPLLPISDSIVSKYTDYPLTAGTGKLLPVMSNQRMNSYLKELLIYVESIRT